LWIIVLVTPWLDPQGLHLHKETFECRKQNTIYNWKWKVVLFHIFISGWQFLLGSIIIGVEAVRICGAQNIGDVCVSHVGFCKQLWNKCINILKYHEKFLISLKISGEFLSFDWQSWVNFCSLPDTSLFSCL